MFSSLDFAIWYVQNAWERHCTIGKLDGVHPHPTPPGAILRSTFWFPPGKNSV